MTTRLKHFREVVEAAILVMGFAGLIALSACGELAVAHCETTISSAVVTWQSEIEAAPAFRPLRDDPACARMMERWDGVSPPPSAADLSCPALTEGVRFMFLNFYLTKLQSAADLEARKLVLAELLAEAQFVSGDFPVAGPAVAAAATACDVRPAPAAQGVRRP